jgi:hypothetical protein
VYALQSAVLLCTSLLSEDESSRAQRLPFVLSCLETCGDDLRLSDSAAATQMTVRASPLGKLYARVVEMLSSSDAAARHDSAAVLLTCMLSGGCGSRALDVFHKQWLACANAMLQPKNSWTVRGWGCLCLSALFSGATTAGRDTALGRDVHTACTALLPLVQRVIEGPSSSGDTSMYGMGRAAQHGDEYAGAAASALRLYCTLLSIAPQSLRSVAPKLTTRCMLDVDSLHEAVAVQSQRCLALLCLQVRFGVVIAVVTAAVIAEDSAVIIVAAILVVIAVAIAVIIAVIIADVAAVIAISVTVGR